MRNAWFAVTLALGLGLPSAVRAQGDHDGASQPIDPAWLTADTASNTATFELMAGLTGLNGALNFNGFRDGGLTLTVPLGWTVVMHFRNHDGMFPHPAGVTPPPHPLPPVPLT